MAVSHSAVQIVLAAGLALLVVLPGARAQQAREVVVTYRNKHFQPAEVNAPQNTQLTLRIKNNDAEPMEFESETLHIEKIVNGKSEATIPVPPLKPGKYGFFDDDNATSEGVLTVK